MPKDQTKSSSRDAIARHHLEEAATHIRAVEVILQERGIDTEAKGFRKVGKWLKSMYVAHGGHPDA